MILRSNEYDKNPISSGQKIKAVIHFGGDEFFGGYFLSDIEVLDTQTVNQNANTDQFQNYNIPELVNQPGAAGLGINQYYLGFLVVVIVLFVICLIILIKLIKK